ncbi:glycerol kinase GlpK [Roseiarcaceae bacterium H3SJ34-1]|uniref:glycerol kinase GlpK n=1 Tax=Terripilifer ovatus TaxID=3032367 RepID=UPI003AB99C78|nr:glycerol kinase GlpK [Roseiarcaceae bacterium H3SJ34-1]
MGSCIIALDQGTTSTRALVFDTHLAVLAIAQREFPQHYPASGWVEHDPEDIWQSALATLREALKVADIPAADVAAIGITNQRETTLVWDRATGRPIHNAIIWQDRRTADLCTRLREAGVEAKATEKTGLLLDPYFSATKCAWILDHVPGARASAAAGQLAFGTVDSFLLWRLSGGAVHATDATNASRTLLYNIHAGEWDEELCRIFDVPMTMLPQVRDNAAEFGHATADVLGQPVPIRSMIGDQQAAMVGQACFVPGMMKSTYGTGCFALLNTGRKAVQSQNRLLATVAYQLAGQRTYALEGSIFVAGAAVQWLRDGLGILHAAAEADSLAAAADPAQDVYLVPAFVGLGAPYWDADARGTLFGLTRATSKRELARAALESVGYQTRDLIEAMRRDWPEAGATVLRVDGGMSASDWAMQFLADILDMPVERPRLMETTALGAAYLAGLAAGLLPRPDEMTQTWALDRRFEPNLLPERREAKWQGWRDAVARTLQRG